MEGMDGVTRSMRRVRSGWRVGIAFRRALLIAGLLVLSCLVTAAAEDYSLQYEEIWGSSEAELIIGTETSIIWGLGGPKASTHSQGNRRPNIRSRG